MATIKLPFVHTFYDSRGKRRHVYRRKGHRTVTISGRRADDHFDAAIGWQRP